jgi:hypothetical protein
MKIQFILSGSARTCKEHTTTGTAWYWRWHLVLLVPQVQGPSTVKLLFVGGFVKDALFISPLLITFPELESRIAEEVSSVTILEEMECQHLPWNPCGSYEMPLKLIGIFQGFLIDLLCPINEKCQFQFLWVFESVYFFLIYPVQLVIRSDTKDGSSWWGVNDGQRLCITLNAPTKLK